MTSGAIDQTQGAQSPGASLRGAQRHLAPGHRTARYFESLSREHGFEPLRVEGALPAELSGTLYRVGPGLLDFAGQRYEHLFEGDGAVCAVRLGGGVARGAHRVVQSNALAEEQQRGRPLFSSNASWPWRLLNGLRMRIKNAANTNLMCWQGRLFALHEVSPPTELSAEQLDTLGESDLDGAVVQAFSAHPHAVASRGALYNFGLRYGRHTALDVYEMPREGPARRLVTLPLERAVMLHDFIATENHLVFFIPPARLLVWRALLGLNPFTRLFRWHPEDGTEVVVVPIDRPDETVRFTTEAFYQWHFAGAFERDGELLVDIVRYPDFATFEELGEDGVGENGTLTRVTIDMARRRLRHEPLSEAACEFPRIDPRRAGTRHRHVWLACDETAGSALLHVDTKTGETRRHQVEHHQRVSEPIFVPRSAGADEDDGYLLSLLYDGRSHTSHVAVFDARKLPDGPLARVHFDHHVPMTFHGIWQPSAS